MCWNWICMCVQAKIVWFCWIQRTNCGVAANEFSLRTLLSTTNQFCYRTVLSAPNEFSLPNCVVCSDEFSLPNYVFRSESGVRCWIVLYVANEFSLPNCVSTEYRTRHHGGLKNLSLERTNFWHPILWLRSHHLVL